MIKRRRIVNSDMPPGLFYIPEAISVLEEQQCLSEIDRLPFEPYVFGEYLAKRTVVQFGGQEYRASYGGNQAMESMPGWLAGLRDKCASLLQFSESELAQSLVAKYDQAGIGWHRDAPQFGPTVIGISLLTPAIMRFRKMTAETEELFRLELVPRSMYIISGEARSDWQHSMPVTKGVRYSITFRTISKVQPDRSFGRAERAKDPRHQPKTIADRLLAAQIAFQASHLSPAAVLMEPPQWQAIRTAKQGTELPQKPSAKKSQKRATSTSNSEEVVQLKLF